MHPESTGVTPREIAIEVLRYRSETDERPVLQTYRVPFTDDMSVLQGLQYIKDHLDGTLSFRWSCRMAICGSCGMMTIFRDRCAWRRSSIFRSSATSW